MTLRSLFLFVFTLLCAVPAAAQDNSLYTVTNVHVDATGASSTEALNAAISQGRGKAFQTVYRRLTRQADWGKQPALDAAGLLRISRGYNIANERRSTTRYVADITFMFNPDAGARLLRSSQIAFSLPRVVGGGGAERTLPPELSPDERTALRRSAALLKESGGALGLGAAQSPVRSVHGDPPNRTG